jgi:crotonobetainyl-CoA:carnitine CoA-transferase CaiB-like acyl-CoA transferase
MSERPLTGVRVVDLTDARGIYGAKLLADLGATVLRPEPPGGDALRARGPRLRDAAGEENGASLWYAFFASSRKLLEVDRADPAARARLQQVVARADIVLTCAGAFGTDLVDLGAARTARPALVEVATSSFGDDGPWRDLLAPDLVAGALGGAVCTTGAPDTPPLKSFGELNFMVSGVYVAIAALSALRHARETGEGQRVSVPVHATVASCLEQVFMFHFYGDLMGRGKVLPRQAGTHWSMAYTVMPAKTGAIMVTPAPDVEAQVNWLVEEDAHADLLDPKYYDPANPTLLLPRLMQLLRAWVGTKDAETLFYEAQDRHAPYGWVQPIERLADNPQLQAREWWTTFHPDGPDGRPITAPGAPYRFSETPCTPADPEALAPVSDAALLAELGWEVAR